MTTMPPLPRTQMQAAQGKKACDERKYGRDPIVSASRSHANGINCPELYANSAASEVPDGVFHCPPPPYSSHSAAFPPPPTTPPLILRDGQVLHPIALRVHAEHAMQVALDAWVQACRVLAMVDGALVTMQQQQQQA
jgi:hypothetical protein